MFIKKQHKKTNIATVDQLKQLKQGCCLKAPTFNNSVYFGNASAAISKNNKLIIRFKSYAICQAQDTSSSIKTIEKLIDYLNSICAQQLHTYSGLSAVKSLLSSTTDKQFSPVVLGFFTPSYTDLLNCQSTVLPRYQKQQSNYKVINYNHCCNSNSKGFVSQLTNHLKQNHSFAERFEQSSYFDRCFFKLSKRFSSLSTINKKQIQTTNSTKLLTVIRAPFVFKKTREQFSLQRLSSHIVITLANSAQKQFLIQNLRLLKLPTELKVVSRN